MHLYTGVLFYLTDASLCIGYGTSKAYLGSCSNNLIKLRYATDSLGYHSLYTGA